jgi:hypothetical protein
VFTKQTIYTMKNWTEMLLNRERNRRIVLSYVETRISRKEKHTVLGLLWTISTASWFVMCSQRPSDANITNLSLGCKTIEHIDGSADRTGRRIGSDKWNFGNDGSKENSGRFKYASPIDLDTWSQLSHGQKTCICYNEQ